MPCWQNWCSPERPFPLGGAHEAERRDELNLQNSLGGQIDTSRPWTATAQITDTSTEMMSSAQSG
jgi:hypothetical protein